MRTAYRWVCVIAWVQFTVAANGQSISFLKASGIHATNRAECLDSVVDAEGNTYITGYFLGTVDLDPAAGDDHQALFGGVGNSYDIFIVKLGASGDYLWGIPLGGSSDDEGSHVVLGPDGTIAVVGIFRGTVDFDPSDGTHQLTAGGSDVSTFLLRLTSQGQFLSVGEIGDEGVAIPFDVVTDDSRNVYITGYLSQQGDFDPGPDITPLSTVGGDDIFLVKFDATGNFVWGKSWGGSADDYGNGVAVDSAGNVYVAGSFRQSVDFDPGANVISRTSSGHEDAFVSKFNSNGQFVWVKIVGANGEDHARGVATDSTGDVYIAGMFQYSVDFNPNDGIFTRITPNNLWDAYILKLDGTGQFQWVKSFGDSGSDRGYHVKADPFGNVVLLGTLVRTVDLDPGTAVYNVTTPGNGSNNVFAVSLTSGGDFVWGGIMPSVSENDVRSERISPDGVLTVAGVFRDLADVDLTSENHGLADDAVFGGYVAEFQLQQVFGITFDDPQLELAVREATGVLSGPIQESDLVGLTTLSAVGRGIASLAGLNHATDLTTLSLSYNSLAAIGELASLPALQAVELYGNPLTQDAICDIIPVLEAGGVDVGFNGTCGIAQPGSIAGFVLDANGDPVGCGSVLVSEAGAFVGTAIVDAGGYYEVRGLVRARMYTLRFDASGFVAKEIQHTVATASDSLDLTLLNDPAAADLTGTVHEKEQSEIAVPGALVVISQNGSVLARTVTCDSGAFEVSDLPANKIPVNVTISAPGYRTIVLQTDLATNINVPLSKFELPNSIIGTVFDKEGDDAVPSAAIVVQQVPGGFSAVRVSTGNGGYSVSDIPAGEYEVRAVLPNLGWGMRSITVNNGLATIDVVLDQDLQAPCTPPAAPTTVTATDGTETDGVHLMWAAVQGASIEYQVLRSSSANSANAVPVSDWTAATTFVDTSAAAPVTGAGDGCNGGGTAYTTYHYWVITRAAIDPDCQSDPGAGDTGYRGADAKVVQTAGVSATCLLFALAMGTLLAFRPVPRMRR